MADQWRKLEVVDEEVVVTTRRYALRDDQ